MTIIHKCAVSDVGGIAGRYSDCSCQLKVCLTMGDKLARQLSELPGPRTNPSASAGYEMMLKKYTCQEYLGTDI